jgi:H+-transporting ATPase
MPAPDEVPPSETDAEGLSGAEAARRLARFGPNAVAEPAEAPIRGFARHFWAPVPWMLEAAILLQASLGEYLEASVICGLLLFNALLSFFQQSRAQAALELLKARLALTASVRRDNAWSIRPAAELVPGDIVKLSLGAVVPADLRLLSGSVLLDQSMLTGESIPAETAAGGSAYAGALVRRGEAVGTVVATGARGYFGRTAELVRIAHAESAEQRAILGVVRNLAVLNGAVVALLVAYARFAGMPLAEGISLVLTAILASVPVALPATFTLATALSAQRLVRLGVLPTRLSAVHEAATMDVLCADKTGTLTRNALRVAAVRPLPGFDADRLLAPSALASADGGKDPVDAAVREAAERHLAGAAADRLVTFIPFDPASKMSEAEIMTAEGPWRVVKGAFGTVSGLTRAPPGRVPPEAAATLAELTEQGHRVLAVAAGPPGAPRLAGLIALSDPPRADSAGLIAELATLGVRTVMVTGDAPATAEVIARRVGLAGPTCPPGGIPESVAATDYQVFAGVFPEDKYRLVKAFQRSGHTVGMCGDGANDAPALRQAQVGIAVSTATDVAKSAAGIVLTRPGLAGIVAAVKEGRATFQRILTYTLNALIKKIETVLFLGIGLVMTRQAVVTPLLMVLLLVTNDFLTMSLTTDRGRPSGRPDTWRIGRFTAAAVALGLLKLAFLTAVLAAGFHGLGLPIGQLRTLAFIALAFGGQATVYVVRERRHLWSSAPSIWVVLSSVADVAIATALATSGVLIVPLPARVVAATLGATVVFALLLDTWKQAVFTRLKIT